MGSMFLQVTDATVVLFDLKSFGKLASRLGPLELGASLARYYEHVESVVLGHGGRVIRFVGDLAVGAWLASATEDCSRQALQALAEAHSKRPAWIQAGIDLGMPLLDYTMAATAGSVLVGQIGTERMRSFDVLGEPVTDARKLTTLANARGLDHLFTFETLEAIPASDRPSAVEVEGIELGDRSLRLFRLA